jgi:transcriptional regulator with XRE-family HTH domain
MIALQEAETEVAIGRAIRARRRILGLTQKDVADAVGVRFQQIQKYETGANKVSASRLQSIAHALSCSVCDLYPRKK